MGYQARASCSCDACSNAIPLLDFEEGQAAMIQGKAYCASCMEEGTWFGRASSPAQPAVPERRAHPRYIPSLQCDLRLKLPGLRGVFAGNLVRLWLDVSEGGFRAVVRRKCAEGDRLAARIFHRPRKRTFRVTACVRYAQGSRKFLGEFVVGAEFEKPSADLRAFIRDLHGGAGFLKSGEGPGPKGTG